MHSGYWLIRSSLPLMVCSPDTDFAGVNGLFLDSKVERQQLPAQWKPEGQYDCSTWGICDIEDAKVFFSRWGQGMDTVSWIKFGSTCTFSTIMWNLATDYVLLHCHYWPQIHLASIESVRVLNTRALLAIKCYSFRVKVLQMFCKRWFEKSHNNKTPRQRECSEWKLQKSKQTFDFLLKLQCDRKDITVRNRLTPLDSSGALSNFF